ncbi:MAG: VanW family protein [Lachnospiraceae bacterium]|nr:VanW family protein [Lachnospiraceae bacterium]
MKKLQQLLLLAAVFFAASLVPQAAFADSVIPNGVSIGTVDVSGLTTEEAEAKVEESIAETTEKTVQLDLSDLGTVDTTVEELGYGWTNQEVLEEASGLCTQGNVIKRYKDKKDLEVNTISYDLEVGTDEELVTAYVEALKEEYDEPAENASITELYTDGTFTYSSSKSGQVIDEEAAVETILAWLDSDMQTTTISLSVVADEPTVTEDDLASVTYTALGSYSTSFSAGNTNRNGNLKNGMSKLDGIILQPGETFSMQDTMMPYTAANGWYEAGTYSNGTTVLSYGGGICQVTSTLYNAVLLAELEVNERHPHSMSVSYVPISADAAVSGTAKDFKFTNSTDYPIYIHATYSSGGTLTVTIYGVETRAANRTITYVSETLTKTTAKISYTVDSSKSSSYRVTTSSGHTGYTGQLWKYVYVDGELQSKEVVNTSSYSNSTTYVTVGSGADTSNTGGVKSDVNTTTTVSNSADVKTQEEETTTEETTTEETTTTEEQTQTTTAETTTKNSETTTTKNTGTTTTTKNSETTTTKNTETTTTTEPSTETTTPEPTTETTTTEPVTETTTTEPATETTTPEPTSETTTMDSGEEESGN